MSTDIKYMDVIIWGCTYTFDILGGVFISMKFCFLRVKLNFRWFRSFSNDTYNLLLYRLTLSFSILIVCFCHSSTWQHLSIPQNILWVGMGQTPVTCTYIHTMTAGSIFKIGNYIREYIGILYGFIGFTNKSS